MSILAIIAALPGELRQLTGGWDRLPSNQAAKGAAAWQGRVGRADCIAVAAGMGADAVARAFEVAASSAAKSGGLNGVVSIGWAGAISCGLSPGRAYWVAEIVDGETGTRVETSLVPNAAPRLTLATISHVAQPEEKKMLGRTYAAVMVDMEAVNLARIAQGKHLPFYCLKAISDSPGEVLPDFSRHTDPQGKLRFTSLVPYLLVRPAYWRTMLRMGKNSKSGAQSLAAGLRAFLVDQKECKQQT